METKRKQEDIKALAKAALERNREETERKPEVSGGGNQGNHDHSIEGVAVRVFSDLFGCFLWVVADEVDLDALRASGEAEPAYTAEEITEMRKLPDGAAVRIIHRAKREFPESTVREVRRDGE